MNIEKIHIENYKGIQELDLVFHPKFNVFIGDNASGKTSLLEAVFKSCVSLTSKIKSPSVHNNLGFRFSAFDINHSSKFLLIESIIKH